MKRYFWPTIILIAFFTTSCETQSRLERDKEAIIAVINEETEAVRSGDFERFKATHVMDSTETRLELGVHNYNFYNGWDEVGDLIEGLTEGGPLEDSNSKKENFIIKVNGKSAWLICDNMWTLGPEGDKGPEKTIQIAFLEKVKGVWKISFAAYYGTP